MTKSKLLSGTFLASVLTLGSAAMAADIVIGEPNWPSGSGVAHLMKVIIEDNLGLTVELQSANNAVIFEAMDKGSMHLHPEVNLPGQQNLYDTYVVEKGSVVMNEHGIVGFQGICVDTATAQAQNVKTIEDLTDPDKAALFDSDGDGKGDMWIGAPGWASTKVEQIRAKSYGYDQVLNLTQSDETVAYAALDAAIDAGKSWLGFCYAPHYIFALYDVTILEEPPHDDANWDVKQPTDDPNWLENSKAESAWAPISLHLMYQKALEESHPQVAQLFRNVNLDAEMESEMTKALVIDKMLPSDFAKEWIAAHPDQVIGWFTD